MKDYELLRIQLLKTLLQMEEMLLVSAEDENNKPNVNAKSSKEDLTYQRDNVQMKAVYSVSELSSYLGVSTDCIYTMVRENQIPFVKIRRRILFYRDSINSWMKTNTSL